LDTIPRWGSDTAGPVLVRYVVTGEARKCLLLPGAGEAACRPAEPGSIGFAVVVIADAPLPGVTTPPTATLPPAEPGDAAVAAVVVALAGIGLGSVAVALALDPRRRRPARRR
jgi:hypothetical protein